MPGPWLDSTTLYAIVQDLLSTQALPAKWTGICARSAMAAYTDLRNILSAKGYTEAQMDAWDDRVTYSTDQAEFWAHVEGGIFTNQPDVAARKDRREELRKSVGIMIGGALVSPGATDTAVGVGSGDLVQQAGGVNYGTTFGLKCNRLNGVNQYGDPIYPDPPPPAGADW